MPPAIPSQRQNSSPFLTVTEHDAAGALLRTYISSSGPKAETTSSLDRITSKRAADDDASAWSRVDVVTPSDAKPAWYRLADAFLPSGYPHSVTEDYTAYQIYDSLQAFVSSIASMLSSRAVLEGVGVGDASSTPTTALLLTTLLPSTASRIATILFAHRFGLALEPECKRYRLLADMLNDGAMLLDLLSPALPGMRLRVGFLGASAVLRALCGVAAGSSKASLSQHFARWGNLGEVNAKDSSQETVISLVGTLVGSLVVSRITSKSATWLTLIILLTLHLLFNHAAVRAVSMRSLNRQRANIVLSHLASSTTDATALSPQQVSQRERIFERDGVLRDASGVRTGWCRIGCPLGDVLRCMCVASSSRTQSTIHDSQADLQALLELFEQEDYVLWFSARENLELTVIIALKQAAGSECMLKAWYHALLLAKAFTGASLDQVEDGGERKSSEKANDASRMQRELHHVADALRRTNETFNGCRVKMLQAGWDLDTSALETSSGTRLVLGN